jgi:hypothetical protein
MKNLNYLLLFFLLPLYGHAQQLSGIWSGILSNDSITIRKDQSFEIALTEYRGKVYGYAYSTFIVYDTLYYIVKKVKGEINGDVCEVKDEDVVTHNFRKKPDRGVHVVYTFRRNQNDSLWNLEGDWKTNATKKYYALSGSVKAKQEKDIARSKLYDHLGDLKLQNTLAFNKPKDSNTKKKTPKEIETKYNVAKTETSPVNKKKDTEVDNANVQKPNRKKDITKPDQTAAENIARADVKKTDAINTNPPKQEVKNNIAKADEKTDENKSFSEYVFTELKKTERKLKLAAAMLAERESVPSETIYFKSDSLVLALYDNGEVDGDTVSVIFDGKLMIEKQVLKSVAFKKTIYLSPDETDSVLLVLYAENLGIYPPNTGLLIIKDGEESFTVRFKADFDRNAAILLRKKLK